VRPSVAGRLALLLQQVARRRQHAIGDLAGVDRQRTVFDRLLDRLDMRRVDIRRTGAREAVQMRRQPRQIHIGVARRARGRRRTCAARRGGVALLRALQPVFQRLQA